jgi:hypothetical protein
VAPNVHRHHERHYVNAKAGPRSTGGVGAAIVRCEQLDVLMKLAAVHLVLDPVVGKMNLVIEVWQIVFARPIPDLVLVAARPAVAVRSVAVVILQEFLVLARQI